MELGERLARVGLTMQEPVPGGNGAPTRAGGRRRGRGADPTTGQAIHGFGDDPKASIRCWVDLADTAMAAATWACDLDGGTADPRQGPPLMLGTSPIGAIGWISDGLMYMNA